MPGTIITIPDVSLIAYAVVTALVLVAAFLVVSEWAKR